MPVGRNKTRYLILGLLSEGPMSGYDMKRLVDMRFSYFWSESYGQIYPELKRLVNEGFVKRVVADDKEGLAVSGKVKKVFAITDKGNDVMRQWLAQPVEKEVMRFEILLKLYNANMAPPDVMLEHVQEFKANHLRQQEAFRGFEQQIRSVGEVSEGHDNHPFVLMVLLFGQKVCKAYDEWCDEVIAMLEIRKKGNAIMQGGMLP